MPTGYRGNPAWRDMSDFLVHLTDDVDRLGRVLGEGRIAATGPFGAIWNWESFHGEVAPGTQRSVCLSEIPLDYLGRLVARHGAYGVGFSKSIIVARGGTRVWYLERGSRMGNVFFNMVKKTAYPRTADFDPADPLWALTPFVDYVSDGSTGTPHAFEWEREWRHPGDLAFGVADVAFLFMPEEQHDRARQSLSIHYGDPALVPQLIDASWGEDRLQDALAILDPPQTP